MTSKAKAWQCFIPYGVVTWILETRYLILDTGDLDIYLTLDIGDMDT